MMVVIAQGFGLSIVMAKNRPAEILVQELLSDHRHLFYTVATHRDNSSFYIYIMGTYSVPSLLQNPCAQYAIRSRRRIEVKSVSPEEP